MIVCKDMILSKWVVNERIGIHYLAQSPILIHLNRKTKGKEIPIKTSLSAYHVRSFIFWTIIVCHSATRNILSNHGAREALN